MVTSDPSATLRSGAVSGAVRRPGGQTAAQGTWHRGQMVPVGIEQNRRQRGGESSNANSCPFFFIVAQGYSKVKLQVCCKKAECAVMLAGRAY